MKKIARTFIVAACAFSICALFEASANAQPPPRHHHGGSDGVRLAGDIVHLVGESVGVLNALTNPQPTVVVQPTPVVVQPVAPAPPPPPPPPAPVVVQPAPVVVQPAPVVVQPPPPPRRPRPYGPPRRHW